MFCAFLTHEGNIEVHRQRFACSFQFHTYLWFENTVVFFFFGLFVYLFIYLWKQSSLPQLFRKNKKGILSILKVAVALN